MRSYDKEEVRAKKRKRTMGLKRRIYFILFLLAVTISVYFCLESPMFNIAHIAVKGNSLLTAEDVISISNIHMGENIFKISTRKNEKYIEKLSFAKQADIQRSLPSDIIIEIIEKEPILIVNNNDRYAYIDEELTVLKIEENNENFTIPLLSNLKVLPIEQNKKLQADKVWLLDWVYKMIQKLRQAGIAEAVSEFYITNDNAVWLYTKGGSVIKIFNQKLFEDNFQFIYTVLCNDNMSSSIELMDNGNHIYRKIK